MANYSRMFGAVESIPKTQYLPQLGLIAQAVRDQMPDLNFNAPLPLAPAPAVPTYFPPALGELPPPPAPAAPQQQIDPALLQMFLSLAGPAPTPPVERPVSTLDKIAAILGGIGGGPEYAQQLRAEREAPRRRYEAQLERYNDRRFQLGLAGTEAQQRAAERRQDALTRDAQNKADREFELYKQRSGIQDKTALQLMDEAHEMAKLREAERINDERLFQQQRLKFGEDLGAQIKFYRQNGVPNPTQARRLALNDFADIAPQFGYAVPELTQADNAQLAKVGATIDRLNRLSRGGAAVGGGARIRAAEKAANDFEASKQAVISAIQRGDVRSERLHRRKMDLTFGRLKQFSDLIESGFGEGNWPYQKPRVGAPAPTGAQPQGRTITMDAVRRSASAAGISEQEAIQRAQAAGYQITQQ